MMPRLLIILFALAIANQGLAQSLQQYTPSVLLTKGQMEFKLFNNLYSQTKVRNEQGKDVDLGQRASYLNNQFRFLYGISNNSRFNIGLEVNYTTAKYADPSTSFFNMFSKDYDYSQSLFASIGPTIKFVPIEGVGNFSVQSTFLFPLNGEDLETPRFVNHNRYTWWTQFYYDHSISDKWNVFFEVDMLYRIKAEDSQTSFFRIPLSAIISFFPKQKLTLYGNIQHAASYGKLPGYEDIEFGRMGWYTQLGVGGKYFVLPNLELEVSYGNFLWSKRDGAGQVFNFGVRLLR